MIFTLEPLKAKEGDCLLLHWGTKEAPRLAVIDGGPGRVFEDFLLPRLNEIRTNRRKLDNKLDRLPIDLVMVSHVDNDHVVGIKKFFRTLKAEIEQNKPVAKRPFKVERLWHNTFDDIVGGDVEGYYKTFTASFTASTKDGAPNPEVVDKMKNALEKKGEDDDAAQDVAHDISLILAGHGEGRELRDSHAFLHKKNEIAALNSPFKREGHGTLITLEMTPEPKDVAGLKFTIIGPMQAQIDALQKAFDKYIKDNGLTAEALLAAYADKSVPNLSSIVCLVELGDKKILLTGDARGDFVLEGLGKAGILKGKTLNVNVLKVPHHGSEHNLERGFFEVIIADTYVFSADGKYGNPDREPLDWLIQARGKDAKYDIILTYPVADIDAIRKEKSKVPWVPAQHSLAALFKDRAAEGYKFNLLAGLATKIELGDKITW
jgi:hypothetical protein